MSVRAGHVRQPPHSSQWRCAMSPPPPSEPTSARHLSAPLHSLSSRAAAARGARGRPARAQSRRHRTRAPAQRLAPPEPLCPARCRRVAAPASHHHRTPTPVTLSLDPAGTTPLARRLSSAPRPPPTSLRRPAPGSGRIRRDPARIRHLRRVPSFSPPSPARTEPANLGFREVDFSRRYNFTKSPKFPDPYAHVHRAVTLHP